LKAMIVPAKPAALKIKQRVIAPDAITDPGISPPSKQKQLARIGRQVGQRAETTGEHHETEASAMSTSPGSGRSTFQTRAAGNQRAAKAREESSMNR